MKEGAENDNFFNDIQEVQQNLEKSQQEDRKKLDSLEKVLKKEQALQSGRIGEIENGYRQFSDALTGFEQKCKGIFEQFQSRMSNITAQQKQQLAAFPKQLEVDIKHRFEVRAKTVIISVAAAIIITAISLAFCIGTYGENRRLRENDLKYRYILLELPVTAFHVDSIYSKERNTFREKLERGELQKRMLEAAQATADKEKMEAQEAEKQVKKLQKQ